MSDLISREKALQEAYQIVIDGEKFEVVQVETLLGLPSAEPERKKGKWEVQPSTGDDRPFIWWKCSECGHVIFSETERDRKEFHAFCGRCGADMRGDR